MSGDLAAWLMGAVGLVLYGGFVIWRKRVRRAEKERMRREFAGEDKP